MKKVLFVVRSFSKGGPQPLRFQKIVELLKSDFEIHVLEIHHFTAESVLLNGIYIHRIEYSKIGKLLNPEINEGFNLKNNIKKRSINFKLKTKALIRSLFFPDTIVYERKKIIKTIIDLTYVNNYETIISSGFPFTTMQIPKALKKIFPNIKFIYDIGDPFYKNSKNGRIKDFFAKWYESKYLPFIDYLVVTNNITRSHYLNTFTNILKPEQVKLIEQGIPVEFITAYEQNNIIHEVSTKKDTISLIHAGQLYLKLREPFELYKAILDLNKERVDITYQLKMLGSINEIFKFGYENCRSIFFMGKFSNEDVIKSYYESDIIIFIDNSFGLQTPGKVFEIASIGRPVLFISNHHSSPAKEVIKHLPHIHFCRNESKSIVEAIKVINFDIDKDQILQIRKEFSWENRANQYRMLINAE